MRWTPQLTKAAVQAFNAGETQKSIASRLGTTRKAISAALCRVRNGKRKQPGTFVVRRSGFKKGKEPQTTMRRVRHKKRGTEYDVIARGELQTSRELVDGDELFAYRGDDGRWWFRHIDEFEDGRFEELPQ